jgi:hypothetical protein
MWQPKCYCTKKNPKYHLESKHIKIQFHYICEKTLTGKLKLKYYNNEKIYVDFFTKNVPKEKHMYCVQILGAYFKGVIAMK